jgi:hypothetical protein
MRKTPTLTTASPPADLVGSWTKVSEYRHVHSSGTVIERRGFPIPHGWYLIPAGEGEPAWRFAPSAEGCDEAFVVFAGQQAAARYLAEVLAGISL